MHFIPLDFARESLVSALKNRFYDSTAVSCFSWLGVTYYLSYDSVMSNLRNIANISPGSIIIFDYFDTETFDLEKAASRLKGMLKSAQQMGEPMNVGFNPQRKFESV